MLPRAQHVTRPSITQRNKTITCNAASKRKAQSKRPRRAELGPTEKKIRRILCSCGKRLLLDRHKSYLKHNFSQKFALLLGEAPHPGYRTDCSAHFSRSPFACRLALYDRIWKLMRLRNWQSYARRISQAHFLLQDECRHLSFIFVRSFLSFWTADKRMLCFIFSLTLFPDTFQRRK